MTIKIYIRTPHKNYEAQYLETKLDSDQSIKLDCIDRDCTWGNEYASHGTYRLFGTIKSMADMGEKEKIIQTMCGGKKCSKKALRSHNPCPNDFDIKIVLEDDAK